MKTRNLALMLLLAVGSSNSYSVMYCDGMGALGLLAAKMRDAGRTQKQTINDIRKMSPTKTISKDVIDLIESAFLKPMGKRSPEEFQEFFVLYCRVNGFDREL